VRYCDIGRVEVAFHGQQGDDFCHGDLCRSGDGDIYITLRFVAGSIGRRQEAIENKLTSRKEVIDQS